MRYLVIAAAVLVAIVLIVLLVGRSLPVQHRATSEATLRVSPQSVYWLISATDLLREGARLVALRLLPKPDSVAPARRGLTTSRPFSSFKSGASHDTSDNKRTEREQGPRCGDLMLFDAENVRAVKHDRIAAPCIFEPI